MVAGSGGDRSCCLGSPGGMGPFAGAKQRLQTQDWRAIEETKPTDNTIEMLVLSLYKVLKLIRADEKLGFLCVFLQHPPAPRIFPPITAGDAEQTIALCLSASLSFLFDS